MWPWCVKMATQDLLKLLLLLKLMMRNMLTTVRCRFGRLTLVIKLSFCPDFEMRFQGLLRFWSWCSGKILKLYRRCNQGSRLKKQWLHATWKLNTFTRMLDCQRWYERYNKWTLNLMFVFAFAKFEYKYKYKCKCTIVIISYGKILLVWIYLFVIIILLHLSNLWLFDRRLQ